MIETLAAARMVYFSGITLGILPDEGRAALFSLLQTVRARDGAVAFDSNYRPRLWPDAETARRVIGEALLHTTIALPSFDDEAMLFGDADPAATAARLQGAGVPEVVVTSGADGCFIALGEQHMPIASPRVEAPRDTTAAGDAFNGAYLAARLQGIAPEIAAERGMALAARVIQYPGAIMPREDA
jgi:2-dehydro-3-deoxygluconokinase